MGGGDRPLFPNATAFNSKAFNSVAGLLLTDFTE